MKTFGEKIRQGIEQEYNSLLPQYQDELKSILNKSTRLFPQGWVISKDSTETYRALCILSQAGLTSSTKITSHRKIVGPVIVFFKKIIWKILDSQLKNTFAGINSCFSHCISQTAKLETSLKQLEKEA